MPVTFNANHYVPVLKIKRGEKKALGMLSPAVRANITPLLEIVENKSGKTIGEHLDTAFDGLPQAVRGFTRFFLDAREIRSDGSSSAKDVFCRARAIGHTFTPVTGISRVVDVVAALEAATDGIAVRVTRKDFESGIIATQLPRFLVEHHLSKEHVDLLVDLGPVDNMVMAGIALLTQQFINAIPAQQQWRTFTLLASAFPLSMKGIGRNSHVFVDRMEWLSWKDTLYTRRADLERLPTFGDCAIQHPRGVEGFDPRIMPMSAAVRYALADKWLIIKGESKDTTPLKRQFPMLAAMLTEGPLSAHFAGVGHCAGCSYMVRAAQGEPGLGSPEAWRRLGTAHHITQASEQIRALVWS
jgi:hypothetical protein